MILDERLIIITIGLIWGPFNSLVRISNIRIVWRLQIILALRIRNLSFLLILYVLTIDNGPIFQEFLFEHTQDRIPIDILLKINIMIFFLYNSVFFDRILINGIFFDFPNKVRLWFLLDFGLGFWWYFFWDWFLWCWVITYLLNWGGTAFGYWFLWC